MFWRRKRRGSLPGQRRTVADGVPGGANKIKEWLVAALAAEMRRREWQNEVVKRENKDRGKKLVFADFGF
jgi:hypothetical protein